MSARHLRHLLLQGHGLPWPRHLWHFFCLPHHCRTTGAWLHCCRDHLSRLDQYRCTTRVKDCSIAKPLVIISEDAFSCWRRLNRWWWWWRQLGWLSTCCRCKWSCCCWIGAISPPAVPRLRLESVTFSLHFRTVGLHVACRRAAPATVCSSACWRRWWGWQQLRWLGTRCRG